MTSSWCSTTGSTGRSSRSATGARRAPALGLPADRPLVGYVGNLAHKKGPDVLVAAMAELAKRSSREVDLAIIGAGAVEPALREQALALGVAGRVRFVGRKVHDEIPQWINVFDVFCLPSRREGCPNVVLEALASGRPVVASRVGGVPELLRKDNGLLVPPDRPAELAPRSTPRSRAPGTRRRSAPRSRAFRGTPLPAPTTASSARWSRPIVLVERPSTPLRSAMPIEVVCVAGARPNFMNIAPILRSLRARPAFDARLVHTGSTTTTSCPKILFGTSRSPGRTWSSPSGRRRTRCRRRTSCWRSSRCSRASSPSACSWSATSTRRSRARS